MSYCPRPSTKKSKGYTATPGKKTVTGGTAKAESCTTSGTSSVVTNPGTPSETSITTVYVPGPPGPTGAAGAAGLDGKDGISIKWMSEWAIGQAYQAMDETTYRFYEIVAHNGSTWICTADNTSTSSVTPEHEPGVDSAWSLIAEKGVGFTPGDKPFFDQLKDDVFDWVKNASLGDLLQAGAIAAGVIWAGSKIISSMSDDGTGDGSADSKYAGGTPGYVTSAYTAPDIKDVLTQLCEYAGIPYDVSAMPADKCQCLIGQSVSIRTVLTQLALAYQFDMVDSAGVLKFVPLSTTVAKTLTDNDIGYGSGQVAPARYGAKRFQGIDLPRSVTLKYIADDTDYNAMTQVSQLPTYDEGQDVQLEVPVTLEHTKAKQIADVSLIQAHIERTQYKFPVSYNQLDLEPGDVIGTPMGNIRIKRIGEMDEGIIEIEGTDAGVAEATAGSGSTAAIPPASTNIPVSLGYSQGFWIDPTALSQDDTGTRMYVAVHGYDRAGWPGAAIYVSENGGASYDQVTIARNEATVGLVGTATPSANYLVWDNSTTISVVLKTNELASKFEVDVLNGKNWAQIGQEVIGFKTATLTAPKTYTLSGLLRGRRGTEQFVGTHSANELFVMLDENLTRIDLVAKDRSTMKKYKIVTLGSSLDKVAGEDVYITSNNLRMWTVQSPKVLHVGSDWQFSFGERVRYLGGLTDGAEIVHDADWAGFGIVIFDTDGTTVKNRYTTTSETWTYTAAMQTTDFGSVQSVVKSSVVQLSQLGVPGYPTSLNS